MSAILFLLFRCLLFRGVCGVSGVLFFAIASPVSVHFTINTSVREAVFVRVDASIHDKTVYDPLLIAYIMCLFHYKIVYSFALYPNNHMIHYGYVAKRMRVF